MFNTAGGGFMEKIGFIGLGNMGKRIAMAIANKSYPLTVFDVNPRALKEFTANAKGGVSAAADAAEILEKSDIVFLSLPSSKIVEPIIESFIRKGVKGKIIVDTSTSYPLSTRNLHKKVKEAGGDLVDLPISGVPADADSGKLLALFGGDAPLFEKLRPVAECFANRYANLGPSGSGHVTKLIFNFIALSYVNIYAMAFPLTEKMGLDNQQLYELLKTTGMSCGTFNFYAPKMIGKTYDMAFALELAHKDLSYVKNMFEEFQVPAYALDGTLNLLRTSIRDGRGKEDYSACIATMFEFFAKK
jgi:3-hydroxyisobutyrate dehydrogenase-like beta-hydroxyacid dehydrogenase